MEQKLFIPLKVSSKFPICNLPLRLDTYNNCTHQCSYCFSNNRQIGKRNLNASPNIHWLKNKFKKIYDDGNVNKDNFLEVLLKNRITLHCGSQSDPFQPQELVYHNTRDIVDLCNQYNQKILFSTKNDTYYDVPLTPNLHTFQLSVSSTIDFDFEVNAPLFKDRYGFYQRLIQEGFKVGIRIQPYIPSISDVEDIVTKFDEAEHFTVESIKLVPGAKINRELIESMGLKEDDFTNMGLLNLKPEIRYSLYISIIKIFKKYDVSYSIADNDLHYLGNNKCCCGDNLIDNSTHFCNTELLHTIGKNYTLNDVFNLSKEYMDCKCSSLFNSDRRNGCVTFKDYYLDRFNRSSSTFSPKFQYYDFMFQSRLF